jgi:hypothetical protein
LLGAATSTAWLKMLPDSVEDIACPSPALSRYPPTATHADAVGQEMASS